MSEKPETITEIRFPITNDFTFKEVFENEKITKRFLESLLGIKLKKLTIRSQAELRPGPLSRWSVLDIDAVDENDNEYDIEMQNGDLRLIPPRYRSYGSTMDVVMLRKGDDFTALHPRVVIFVCGSDPFHAKRKQYTFRNTCVETKELLEDGTELICLNIRGTEGRVNVDIDSFLRYAESGENDGNPLTNAIHREVEKLNADEEFVRQAMTLEEKMREEREAAYTRGKAEGEKKGREEGLQQGIRSAVEMLKKADMNPEAIRKMISEQYHLDPEAVQKYLS